MNTKSLLLLLLFFVSCCITIYSAEADKFFKKVTDLGERYNPRKLYPQGRIFPFSGYSSSDVAKNKKDHHTASGPAYMPLGRKMLNEQCVKNQMPIFFPVHIDYKGKGLSKKTLNSKEPIDWKLVENKIAEVVKSAPKEVAWWFISPEELRYWRKNEYNYIKIAYKTIKANDPLKRPVAMYIPGHYGQKSLEKYTAYMDILGKGMYPNYSGFKNNRIVCRWTIESEVDAIAATKSNAIPIAVSEMFQQPAPEEIEMIPRWVQHDNYLALICGAKGISIYSLARRKNFSAYDKYYNAYAQIADELNGEHALGQVFLFGKKMNDIEMKILSAPKNITVKISNKKTKTYPAVAYLNIAYKDKRYLFAVNSASKEAKVRFIRLPKVPISINNIIEGDKIVETSNGNFELKFNPLEVKCMLLERK